MKIYSFFQGRPERGAKVSPAPWNSSLTGITVGETCYVDSRRHRAFTYLLDNKFSPVVEGGRVSDVYLRRVNQRNSKTGKESRTFTVLSAPDPQHSEVDRRRALILIETFVPRNHRFRGRIFVKSNHSEIMAEGVQMKNGQVHETALVFFDTTRSEQQEVQFCCSNGSCYSVLCNFEEGKVVIEFVSVRFNDLTFKETEALPELGKIIRF